MTENNASQVTQVIGYISPAWVSAIVTMILVLALRVYLATQKCWQISIHVLLQYASKQLQRLEKIENELKQIAKNIKDITK